LNLKVFSKTMRD